MAYSGMKPKFAKGNYMNVESYENFFRLTTGVAKLVYCDVDQLEAVTAKAKFTQPDAIIKENVKDKSGLHENDARSVIIVTEERLMRGFDYRCTEGIALLMARGFSHERALMQGMGRVGRMDDLCERYKLASVETLCPEDGN